MSTKIKNKLRKDIIEKFGTVTYFCEISGISYRKFILFLGSKRNNETIQQLARHQCEILEVKHIKGIIRKDHREAIRQCILIKAGNYSKFNRMNKGQGFDSNYLSNIISGRLKEERKKYKKLVTILKRDYGLVLEE